MKNLFKKRKRQKNFLKPLITNDKQFKSSDVNILLNRVKLDRKKTQKKNILISLLLIGLVCSISIFLII